jgi:hypothetical protein
MLPEGERSGPGQGRPDVTTEPIVTDRRAVERSRRSRRWARRQFDDLFLHVPPSTITTADVLSLTEAPDVGDYWHDMGFDLGMPERVAAGRALRGWAA